MMIVCCKQLVIVSVILVVSDRVLVRLLKPCGNISPVNSLPQYWCKLVGGKSYIMGVVATHIRTRMC